MPYKPWHFFANTKARMVAGLKSMVFGDTNKTEVKVGTDDPSVTAQNMPKGSYYFRTDTPQMWQKQDDGSTTNFRLLTAQEFTLEPTGFVDPEGTGVSYDATTGQITLTHATSIQFLLKGRLYTRTSPWIVTGDLSQAGTPVTVPGAPTPANGRYFLSVDPATATAAWAGSSWTFDKLQIAIVFKNATAHFALREVHGLMQYQSHKENHQVNGTYVSEAITMTSGTAFTSTTAATATTASNCPGIDGGTINDEDIPTTNNAWPEASYTVDTYNSGVYTTAYRNGGSGVITFSTVAQLPYITAGGGVGALQYNPITSGSGALATVTENSYMNVLVLALPVTADVESQKFRYIFLQGQQQFTTLSAAQLQDPKSWDFGELTQSIPEGVAIQMYSYQYNAAAPNPTPATVLGRAFLAALPVTFTGSRGTLTGFTGVAPSDHQTLSNRSAADAHPDTSITATGPFTGTLSGVTTVGAALTTLDGLKTLLTTAAVRASGSGGLSLENNSGNACLLLGAGGGLGATFYDGVNVTGVLDQAAAATLEIGKTNATAITLGKAGITTTNAGAFTCSQAMTVNAKFKAFDSATTLPTTSIGDSAGRHWVGGDSPQLVVFNNAAQGAGNLSTLTLAASTAATSATTASFVRVRAKLDSASAFGASMELVTTSAVNAEVIGATISSVGLVTTNNVTAGASADTVCQAWQRAGNQVFAVEGNTGVGVVNHRAATGYGYDIYVNGTTKGASLSAVGAWTHGPTSGNVSHQTTGKEAVVGTDGGEIIRFQARNTSTTPYKAALLIGGYSTGAGTAYAWIGSYENNTGAAGLKFASYTTEVGGYSSAGSWQVGPNSPSSNVTHGIYGYWVSGDTGAACQIWNYGTASDANGLASPVCRFVKGTNSNATTNTLVDFFINSGNTGSGRIAANGANTAAFQTTSDRRVKENIIPLPSQLSNILALKPVEFDYKDYSGDNPHQVGFIAQDMQEVYPDCVGEGAEGLLSITGWDKTSARLVSAIQEQQAMILALKAELDALKAS